MRYTWWMCKWQRGTRSFSLWLGPFYFYISRGFPGLYHFHFQFEVQDR